MGVKVCVGQAKGATVKTMNPVKSLLHSSRVSVGTKAYWTETRAKRSGVDGSWPVGFRGSSGCDFHDV